MIRSTTVWLSNWGPRFPWGTRSSFRGTAKRSQISDKSHIELCLIGHLRTWWPFFCSSLDNAWKFMLKNKGPWAIEKYLWGPQSRDFKKGCEPLVYIDRIPSDVQENYTIILYFCIFSRRFTKETSCIAESCKSEICRGKTYLRVKQKKRILKSAKKTS